MRGHRENAIVATGYQVFGLAAGGVADVAMNKAGTRIYASMRNGDVRVYDVATRALIATWDVGQALGAVSLSEDGSFLLVVEAAPPSGEGILYRVNTATGTFQTYAKPHPGSYGDVEIVDSDTALVSAGGSGLRLNLTTGTFTPAPEATGSRTVLVEDNRYTLIAYTGASDGALALYDDRTDTVVANGSTYQSSNTGFNWGSQAVSEAAGLVLQFVYFSSINIYDLQLKYLKTVAIQGRADGIAVDESGTYAYVYQIDTGTVARYALATWTLVDEAPVAVSDWHNDIGFGSQLLLSENGRTMTVHDSDADNGRLFLVDLVGAGFTIGGTGGPDTLTGDYGPDTIRGGDGNDTLYGLGGDDTLYGEGGDDILFGGEGRDALNGGSGNDLLDGGDGADAMGGFAGNDLYIVDNEGDTAVEAAGEGTDEIRTALAIFSMAGFANVENLTGTGFAQSLTGNGGDNVVTGTAGDDMLYGAAGNDTLVGLGGADRLEGGAGNDVYVIDGADTIVEAPGGGTDEVRTGASVYVLGADLENLTATGDGGPRDFRGNAGDNVVTGGAGNDIFRLQDGGNDSAFGLGGRDVFYFGGAFTAQDRVDGGGQADILILQGNYGAGVTLGTGGVSNVTGLGSISLFSNTNTLYGGASASPNAYNLTLLNGAIAAGGVLRINATGLASNEHTRIDGSAVTDGALWMYGGFGIDHFIGGAGDDLFIFGPDGRFTSNERIAAGAGNDTLVLRGDYSVTFGPGAGAFTGIETIKLISATDNTFGGGGDGEFDYFINIPANMVPAGTTIVIDGRGLQANESVTGGADIALSSAEGNVHHYGGAASDFFRGGRGDDLFFGGLGADILEGNDGRDLYVYETVADSTTTSFDRIRGFTGSLDRIDLSAIDANVHAAGDQAFRYIDRGAFSGQGAASAGELRVVAEDPFGNWFAEADVDGDGLADLYIRFENADLITAANIVL